MTLEKLKDLLISLYAELQDVKSNNDPDDEILDLLNFMDSELVEAAKIVGELDDPKKLINYDNEIFSFLKGKLSTLQALEFQVIRAKYALLRKKSQTKKEVQDP